MEEIIFYTLGPGDVIEEGDEFYAPDCEDGFGPWYTISKKYIGKIYQNGWKETRRIIEILE